MIDNDVSKQILNRGRQVDQAFTFEANTQKPFGVKSVTIDLTTAKLSTQPMKIGFPFKSIYVINATDTVSNLNMRVNTDDAFQDAINLTQNACINFDHPVAAAYFDWSAQSGKSVTLLFLVEGQFTSGKQLSITGGGVSVSEGTAFVNSQVTLTAATAVSVCASNSLRKVGSIQNTSGASIWVGASSVTSSGANIGIEVPAGGIFQWRNTAQLYAYSVAGGLITLMEET